MYYSTSLSVFLVYLLHTLQKSMGSSEGTFLCSLERTIVGAQPASMEGVNLGGQGRGMSQAVRKADRNQYLVPTLSAFNFSPL